MTLSILITYIKQRLSNNAKQVTHKCTSKYIIAMFSILYDMAEMKAAFLRIFDQTAIPTKTTRYISNSMQLYLDIFISIEKAVRLIISQNK